MKGWHVWRRIALGATLVVLLTGLTASHLPAVSADGSANAGWTEVGIGSASGGGISHTDNMSDATSLAIGRDGQPVVAWVEGTPDANREIYVRRWNGLTWAEMGDGSASGGGISNDPNGSEYPSLAIGGDGLPIVAWASTPPYGSGEDVGENVFVRHWDGTTWAEMGAGSATGPGISGTDTAHSPSLAIAPDGTPIVAYVSGPGNGSQIYVKKWNGSAWVEVGVGSASGGGVSNDGTKSLMPSLAIGPNGRPVVAWVDMPGDIFKDIFVRQFDGSSWVEMGAGSASGGGISHADSGVTWPRVIFGADGNPIVAWSDSDYEGGHIYLKRWNGSAWVEMGGSASGGGISGEVSGFYFALAVRPDGMPVVAWDGESDAGVAVFVRRWNGTAWVELGDGSASGGGISGNTFVGGMPSLALTPTGQPVVAWTQNMMLPGSHNYEIYVCQHEPILFPQAFMPLVGR